MWNLYLHRIFKSPIYNKFMKFMHTLSLKWYSSTKNGIKKNSKTPNICSESLIASIRDNFRSNVGRSSTLLRNPLVFLNNSAYSEITNFDISFIVKQNIIQLNISVKYWSAMTVCHSENHLLEYPSRFSLVKSPMLFNILKQISTSSIFHHH